MIGTGIPCLFAAFVCFSVLSDAEAGHRTDPSPQDPAGAAVSQPRDTLERAAMEVLGRMVGGKWYQGDEFFQTFEWGVGEQAIRAKGYFIANGTPKLVSEGIWFWHPADRVVRAYGVAIDMPMVTWEYETRLSGNELQHVLTTYTADGTPTVMRELWTFRDRDHYEWTLLERAGTDWVKRMGGPFERRRP